MSQITDPDRFFQTTLSIAETNRKALKSKNKQGNLIRLHSKILAIILDPTDEGRVYVAESAGTARRIVLEADNKSHFYRGPTAPLTCLALSPDNTTLFAGCWDKTIWSWNALTRAPGKKYYAHADFVKAVLCVRISGQDFLISGSADACIVVWDLHTGQKLHVLKGHSRGIQDLAIDPAIYGHDSTTVTIFSAGSDREIRRWRIGALEAAELEGERPIVEHETSVYRIVFDADGDLWTASADGMVKCLGRERGWKADTVLRHPDFVRDVAIEERGGWVVSVCRDEEVRVWNRATGELQHTYSGHFEEVTGVVLVRMEAVSVGIDATVRRWSLMPGDLEAAKKEGDGEGGGKEEGDKVGESDVQEGMMTKEEEDELADLIGDDE